MYLVTTLCLLRVLDDTRITDFLSLYRLQSIDLSRTVNSTVTKWTPMLTDEMEQFVIKQLDASRSCLLTYIEQQLADLGKKLIS